jgi:uncharacterized membrane-anchored protein YhcB (DUF1043 family)
MKAIILSSPKPPAPSTSIELTVWKYVIIIAVAAIVIFYIIKRVADIVVKKKTQTMIREVGEAGSDSNNTAGE